MIHKTRCTTVIYILILQNIELGFKILHDIIQYFAGFKIYYTGTHSLVNDSTVQCTNSQHSVNNDCMPQWEQLLTTYLPPSPFPIFPKLCNILNTAPSTHKSPYPSIVSKINVMRSRAIHILIFS